MSRTFDFYEYAGVIVPGSLLILGLLWLFPDWRDLFAKDGVTFGELGLFVIIAYATGQLVQAVGNGIEWVWWKLRGGMPSCQILNGRYVSEDQHRRIIAAVKGHITSSGMDTMADRRAIVREVYSAVASAGKAARVDTFNGNFGLTRGMAAAIIIILVGAVVAHKSLDIEAVLVVMFLLAFYRMQRFGRLYAVELFTQFLTLQERTVTSAAR